MTARHRPGRRATRPAAALLALAGLALVSWTIAGAAAQRPAPASIDHDRSASASAAPGQDAAMPLRVATFNVALNRGEAGALINDLSTPDNAQAKAVAAILQQVRPDVVLLNEFDYDEEHEAIGLFAQNYLEVGQLGAEPLAYPHVFVAPVNTGLPSGFDLDNDGATDGPGDAFGFGTFPGQYGMAVLSRHPFEHEDVRTFQQLLWRDMPGAMLPDDPQTEEPADWFSPEELEVVRLSSKSHWDIPVRTDWGVVHILASHPTPPVFDGPEDRNGLRNHDEIRFWTEYVGDGEDTALGPGVDDRSWIVDDDEIAGGLAPDAHFVIVGDLNADPFDGDSTEAAIQQLLGHAKVNVRIPPTSPGAREMAELQGGLNVDHLANPAFDTADFNDNGPANLRVDYCLPSTTLHMLDAGVFWPSPDDPLFALVGEYDPNLPSPGFPSSDHRLVMADVVPAQPLPDSRVMVGSVEALGVVTIPTGTAFEDTSVGGWSGITWAGASGAGETGTADSTTYYALADDRSQTNPARFYTLGIDVSDGALEPNDVTIHAVTTLRDTRDQPYAAGSIDPEGIALTDEGTLMLTSEGDARAGLAPSITEYEVGGRAMRTLPVREHFSPAPDGSSGVRNNLAFEPLTIAPGGRVLYTGSEAALAQDGPAATLDGGSPARIAAYDLRNHQPTGEWIYPISPIPVAPSPAGSFADNGLPELLALDDAGTLLALERSYAAGVGNTIRLFATTIRDARDVSGLDALPPGDGGDPTAIEGVMSKQLVADIGALGIRPDNVEGMTFGPDLPDGRKLLILVSDNNFNPLQVTQVIALAIQLAPVDPPPPDPTPTAEPVPELGSLYLPRLLRED